MNRETATYIAKGSLKLGFYSCYATGTDGHLPVVVVGRYVGNGPRGLGDFIFEDLREFTDKHPAMEFCIEKNMQIEAVA